MKAIQNNNIDPKHQLALVNKCTAEAWANEDEEIKEVIRVEHAKLKSLAKEPPPEAYYSLEERSKSVFLFFHVFPLLI